MQYKDSTDLPKNAGAVGSGVTKPITRELMTDFALARCFIPYGEEDRNRNRCGCKICAVSCEKGKAHRVTYPRQAGFWGTCYVCGECWAVVEGARGRVKEAGF